MINIKPLPGQGLYVYIVCRVYQASSQNRFAEGGSGGSVVFSGERNPMHNRL